VQLELLGQFHLHDDRRRQRERLVQRQLHLPHHLHGLVLGQLHERHLRSSLRG
jgi:hypothetical protein